MMELPRQWSRALIVAARVIAAMEMHHSCLGWQVAALDLIMLWSAYAMLLETAMQIYMQYVA